MAKDEKKEDVEVNEVEQKAGKEIIAEPVKKVSHDNIYEALAAFQGENPKIERTKQVKVKMKSGETYEFWYAPLDEVLQKVRPLLAKHGLSFVHVNEGEQSATGNARMQCVLYHETYLNGQHGEEAVERTEPDGTKTVSKKPHYEESGVIRSMPITVKRTGDMKDVGSESTYARRYTLAEVLGIAPDEDNDISQEQERTEILEGFVIKRARTSIATAKNTTQLKDNVKVLEGDMLALKEGRPTALGLTEPQYQELMQLAVKRRTELGEDVVDKGAPGENKDGGGQATIGV